MLTKLVQAPQQPAVQLRKIRTVVDSDCSFALVQRDTAARLAKFAAPCAPGRPRWPCPGAPGAAFTVRAALFTSSMSSCARKTERPQSMPLQPQPTPALANLQLPPEPVQPAGSLSRGHALTTVRSMRVMAIPLTRSGSAA